MDGFMEGNEAVYVEEPHLVMEFFSWATELKKIRLSGGI
jgi:hypothetical protein